MSEREQERARGIGSSLGAAAAAAAASGRPGFGGTGSVVRVGSSGSLGRQNGWTRFSNPSLPYGNGGVDGAGGGGSTGYSRPSYHTGGRPAANSISVMTMPTTSAQAQCSNGYPLGCEAVLQPPMMVVPSQNHMVKSRPRASTSPWLPSLFEDHQSWFNDPRFDGSFPSRVLPFLYLGNL